MRRLLVVCGVTVLIYAAFAAAPRNPAGTASAASTGSFQVIAPDPPGCPMGPAVTFCNRFPGTTSDPLLFTVLIETAVNNPTVTFAAVPGLAANFAANDFSITNNTCTGSLPGGSTCAFDVLFSPTTTGLREAAVTFNGKQLINVAGTGATFVLVRPTSAPNCSQPNPSDNAFMYCQEAVGATSATQTFTVMTSSAVTGLNITFAAVPGLSSEFNAVDFTIESTTCTGTLAANGSCTVDVAFTPTTAGLRSTVLTATDSASDTATIYLAGHTNTGLLFTLPISATCSFGNFEFCNEPVGGNSAATTFTLTNISGAQLSGVTAPMTSAAKDFTVTGTNCVSVLAASATCTISVEFTPQAAGLRQDTLTVTDAQGDIGAANLAGTGDNFSLQIVPGQTPELTVIPGGTATFMAQASADSVFVQNGEKIALVCPKNLPKFATCAFNPCPVSVTPGTATPFSVVIVTASAKTPAPPVASACPGTSSANAAPGGFDAPRGPRLVFQVAPQTAPRALRFPAPFVFYLVLLATLAAMAIVLFGARVSSRRRVPLVFGIAGLAAAILLGCGGHGNAISTATPTGVTTMTILANATDSSGNPINASRAFQITLDVVAK